MIESILLTAYINGKNYYEKNINLYKQTFKLKQSMKKTVLERLKQIESMLPNDEQVRNNLSCSCFDSLLSEFKVRSSVYIEESLSLFFNIINIENNVFNIHKISASKVTDNLRAVNINDNIRKYYLNLNDANKSANLPRFPKRNIFRKISHNHSIDMNLSNDCNKVYSNKINFRQNEDNSISTKTTSKKIDGKEIQEKHQNFLIKIKIIKIKKKNKIFQCKRY